MAITDNDQRRLAAIMFTDMVSYSALTQRNEALALELLEEHRRLLRVLFTQFNGREVETRGDGFFVEFSSALQAAHGVLRFNAPWPPATFPPCRHGSSECELAFT